jgi:DNA-directed RNA polymerase specialized sigma subunit
VDDHLAVLQHQKFEKKNSGPNLKAIIKERKNEDNSTMSNQLAAAISVLLREREREINLFFFFKN